MPLGSLHRVFDRGTRKPAVMFGERSLAVAIELDVEEGEVGDCTLSDLELIIQGEPGPSEWSAWCD